jgi:hypothetical protein
VQTFTGHAAHSYLSDAVYPTLLEALLGWVERGKRPTPAAIAQRCAQLEAEYGPGCLFLPDYLPAALESRVPPR